MTSAIGIEDDFNLYAYVFNDPLNGTDPLGKFTINAEFELEAKIGSIIGEALVDAGLWDVKVGGGAVALGVAVSFPAFDGAKFDAGVTMSAAATDVRSDDASTSLPSLPGVKGGVNVGGSLGSVSDLRGKSYSAKVQMNIGKKASTGAVGKLAKILPKGALRKFVEGPLKKAAGAALGFVVSAGVTTDDKGNVNGGEVGVGKGLNVGMSADVTNTVVCSVRTRCSE